MKYSNIVSSSIFVEKWWLDTVCKDSYKELCYRTQNGIEIIMPIFLKRGGCNSASLGGGSAQKCGSILMPYFTQHTSLVFRSADCGEKEDEIANKISEKDILKALDYFADQIKNYSKIVLNLDPRLSNAIAFSFRGCSLKTRYTYRIENLSCIFSKEGGIENILGSGRKYAIKKSLSEGLEVKEASEEDLSRLYQESFKKQGIKLEKKRLDTLKELCRVCKKNANTLILGLYTPKGEIVSSVLVVCRGDIAYYLIGGLSNSTEYRDQTLLICKAIEMAHKKFSCEIFDFEGSMIEGIATFFRSFGSRAFPYICLEKDSRSLLKKVYDRFLTKLDRS